VSAPQDPSIAKDAATADVENQDTEIVPTENWTPERPFDSSDFLEREAPTYLEDDGDGPDAEGAAEDAAEQ
jgi:hypothetical protein